MASSPSQNDIMACSICFEKFKTPRCLPCSHLFCHGCLSSYIVTSCESKEAPIGFSCPLCREFIPSQVSTDKPEIWAENFPIFEMLEKFNQIMESRLCSACQRENEEEEATDICLTCQDLLCEICTKCHRRNRASSAHKIIPINKPDAVMELTSDLLKNENCQEHPNKKLKLYCNDHNKPCCTLCVSMEHRKCDSIEGIQKVTERIKNSSNLQALQEELRNYEAELIKAKKSHEDNISEIDSTSDLITEETKNLKREIIEQLDKFETEHQNELSKVMKESREMLNKNIDSLSDRIQFTKHCLKCLEEVNVETGVSFMKEYHKIKGGFEMLKKRNESKKPLKIKIKSNAARELEQVKNAIFPSKPQVTKSSTILFTDLDLLNADFSLLNDFDEPGLNICCGTFLSDETFIIASFQSSEIGLIKYSLTNNSFTRMKTFQSYSSLFDVLCVEDELYVTDHTNKHVIVISKNTFATLREFSIEYNFKPYGMDFWGTFLFVACETAILKYDVQGMLIHSYPVNERVVYLAVIDNGHIVFSNRTTNDVTAMDDQGNNLWNYSNPKLLAPRGVDKDEKNRIYVAGTDSNNVHILSSNGTLIRIVEDIPKPAFMKVKEGSNICYVCSNWRNIRVYEMK
ncbi:probable E3 ubiquitin-protein ligase MID2 [Saccostrea echinata]|uniref:probable E3 ubiquitin-protein ligase MID2 n=1 Tax=Saccostrea echinata TaxID=191078 RepID=UPI002A80134E|nr:probable E3 ubiquitin-protein ligase MID2 [Saccostrea echinata]